MDRNIYGTGSSGYQGTENESGIVEEAVLGCGGLTVDDNGNGDLVSGNDEITIGGPEKEPEGGFPAQEDAEAEDKTGRRFNQGQPDLSEEELDAVADTAIEIIREMLYYFEAETAEIEEYEGDERELIFDVVGDNLGALIGRYGKNLEALQLLVSAMVSRRMGYHYPIVIDVEGYVNRRKQKLISLAKSSAARAIKTKRSVRLRPMTPYERRVVHMALMSDQRVRTESEGSDPNRQVVIYLA